MSALGLELAEDAGVWRRRFALLIGDINPSGRIWMLSLLELVGDLDRGGLLSGDSDELVGHGRLLEGRPISSIRLCT